MTQEDKQLLLVDLCARLPYRVKCIVNGLDDCTLMPSDIEEEREIKPYLRPMSSMTEEEKMELLHTVVGKDAIEYFQVLSDGSIDNTDAAHQDLNNFTMHWINFDTFNTTSYLDWLNAHHFDYRCLIEKGLALEAPKGMYNVKEK